MRGKLSDNAASDFEKAIFFLNLLLSENCAKYCLDPEPEPKLFLVGTGTATNHYLRFHNSTGTCR